MRTARWLVPAAAAGAIALAVWRRRAGRALGARPYWRAKMDSFDDLKEMGIALAAGESTDSPDVTQGVNMAVLRLLGTGALNLKN